MLRFKQVSSNLFRGSAPKNHEIPILKNKYGITKIISLDEKDGEHITDACKDNGIKQIIIPIHKSYNIDSFNQKDFIKNLIGNDIVFVHCHHGKDRTGLFVAKYRIENGWSCEKALDEALGFGFGTYMNEKEIVDFINVICKNADIPSILKRINENKYNLCKKCGMVKYNGKCDNCLITEAILFISKIIKTAVDNEGVDRKIENIVEESKETPNSYQTTPDASSPGLDSVSNWFSSESTVSSIPNMPTLEAQPAMTGLGKTKNILVRVAFLKKLLKNAVNQQLSYEIPVSEKKAISNCIDLLEKLLHLEVSIYSNHLDTMYKPFKDYSGVTPEQVDKNKEYFLMYLDKLNDYLKNLKIKTLKSIEILQKFKSDTDILSMLKSLDDILDNLKLYQDTLTKLIKEEKSEDFQKNIVKCLEAGKKEIAQLKQLITERIITYLNKNILGNNWSSDIKEDIIKDIKEQKVDEEIDDN